MRAELEEKTVDGTELDYTMQVRESLLGGHVDLGKDPLLRLVCVPKKGQGSFILIAVHQMAEESTRLSGELIAAKCLAYLAGEQSRNLRIRDQIRKKPVKAFYRDGIRVCGMDYDYDPEKPTFIFPCGIILHKSISHLIEAWSDRYNVVVYDTINLHFYELFGGETYDDIVDFYMTLLEFMVPEPDQIFGCIGYSFGGEIAYSMATRSARVRECKPIIFLGDTDMIPSLGMESEKKTTAEDLDDMLVGQLKEHEIPQESMVFAYNMLSYLNARKKTIEFYDGKTVLLLALQNTTDQVIEMRKRLVANVACNLQILEFPDKDHFSLHTDQEMAQVYNELLESYVEERKRIK